MVIKENIIIVWANENRPENIELAENQVRDELVELFCDDSDATIQDFYFHTVFLGKNMRENIITIIPMDADNTVECMFHRGDNLENI